MGGDVSCLPTHSLASQCPRQQDEQQAPIPSPGCGRRFFAPAPLGSVRGVGKTRSHVLDGWVSVRTRCTGALISRAPLSGSSTSMELLVLAVTTNERANKAA
jgi:hypothetical protein